jgi:transmembrane sensor
MTRELTGNERRARRTEQAADWFIRLHEDDVSESALAQWFAWCEDPDNLSEFHAIGQIWRGSLEMGVEPQSVVAQDAPKPSDGHDPRRSSGRRKYALPHFIRPGIWLYAGCALLLLLSSTYIVSHVLGLQKMLAPQRANFSAHAAVHASELPDGTQLVLAPRTAITIDFSGSLRSLDMPRGEAFFKVHPDKRKPFVVTTGGLSVIAVGTAFDVRSEGDKVIVIVQEGVVAVSSVPGAGGGNWRIASGYRMTYDRANRTSTMSTVDPERALAWRTGRLEYLSEDLGVVIADIGRYTSPAIELGDPRLAMMKYTGTVDTAAVKDWLDGLQATFPVRIVLAQDGHYILLNRPQDADVPVRK